VSWKFFADSSLSTSSSKFDEHPTRSSCRIRPEVRPHPTPSRICPGVRGTSWYFRRTTFPGLPGTLPTFVPHSESVRDAIGMFCGLRRTYADYPYSPQCEYMQTWAKPPRFHFYLQNPQSHCLPGLQRCYAKALRMRKTRNRVACQHV
jgi:hypothetical protein